MKPEIRNILGGITGAVVLNIIHEVAKRVSHKAPRIDMLGEEAFTKTVEAVGIEAPTGDALTVSTFIADLASNAGYYAMIGKGDNDNILIRGAGYGLMAGLGAIGLAKPLGLDERPITKTGETKVLTVAWYLLGGLAAALAIKSLR
ncbi:hypothetical protein LZD49_11250 [Dyadobacter sp. CY261]|uniref:hypothetical protein n=1 Tax=Dyadobacter sp. CY261 TaxID=2907203 RepID=UPI001F426772|nr:hypothetical protein [Dyadobacter sp. CY261]MCF0071050.1 hypothetical protein [Dyadobacter sp. CY261]